MPMPTPRVAARYTFQCEPAAFKRAIFFNRLNTVLGTGRCIPARIRQNRRNKVLVCFYQQ